MSIKYKKQSVIISIVVILLTFSEYSAGGEKNIDRNNKYYPIQDLQSIEIKGQISTVNYEGKYIMINMTPIHVVSNMVLKDGTAFTTDVIDEKGNSIAFSDIKNFQRVKVTGYKASDRYIFAVRLQRQRSLPKDKNPGVLSD